MPWRFLALCSLLFWLDFGQAQTIRHVQDRFRLPVNIKNLEIVTRSKYVIVRRRGGSFLDIQITVHTNIRNPQLLETVIRSGRYQWTFQQPNRASWLIYPNCRPNELYQQGSPVQEELTYLIWLPRRIQSIKITQCEEQHD